jgi:hypothetical protein
MVQRVARGAVGGDPLDAGLDRAAGVPHATGQHQEADVERIVSEHGELPVDGAALLDVLDH